MGKFISIYNNKGGVGKTTICWNVADSLARLGKRVLLIDFDPQCNLSLSILGEETFVKTLPTQNVPYGTTIRAYLQRFLQNTGDFEFFYHKGKHTHQNVHLVAGDFWLNVYAESLSVGSDLLTGTGITKYVVIRDMVEFAYDKNGIEYDYILIDLPPSFGSLVRAALYSSDYFIVPATSDTYSSYCISLIGEMLPRFFSDWQSGYQRFEYANPQITKYNGLGKPSFAGWVFSGFDTRSGVFVRADKVHLDNIAKSIRENLIKNNEIISSNDLEEPYMIGKVEDMNVLIQNSIWQNVPVSQLANFRPLKNLQEKGSWSANQRNQIEQLGLAFKNFAENIIKICI